MRKLNPGLIVSCQALKGEPLYGGDTMAKMALAAYEGGAAGLRSNGVGDIAAIAKITQHALPIIGLIKQDYPSSSVYITPTLKEVQALIASECDVIALDATARKRPGNEDLKELVAYLRAHSDKPLMADIATLEEAEAADALGFDYISTTLRGYTEETRGVGIPDLAFFKTLKGHAFHALTVAEGGIRNYDMLKAVVDMGFAYVVMGGAITRPKLITAYYAEAFKG
jgi:N-acylglucosamine-6-phosphate 2-epimerase